MRLLGHAPFASQFPRTPVQFPQAVENRTPDTEFGIGAELHVFRLVELADRVNQADYNCRATEKAASFSSFTVSDATFTWNLNRQ